MTWETTSMETSSESSCNFCCKIIVPWLNRPMQIRQIYLLKKNNRYSRFIPYIDCPSPTNSISPWAILQSSQAVTLHRRLDLLVQLQPRDLYTGEDTQVRREFGEIGRGLRTGRDRYRLVSFLCCFRGLASLDLHVFWH